MNCALFRTDTFCGGVWHQRGDEERDGGVVRAGGDQGEGDRAGADPRPQPGPRAPVIRQCKRYS